MSSIEDENKYNAINFVIGGFQKTSLLDYPQKIACIVFTPKCNFKCGYCHNPELSANSLNKDRAVIDLPSFFAFLDKRVGKLDGVVITGGEPTLQEGLIDFIREVKDKGFCVKLDTNGSNPNILKHLIDEKLVDYVAMDIKAPVDKYEEVTKNPLAASKVKISIDILLNSGIDYEFRTTVVSEQLEINDFEKIGQMIKGAKKYFLQKFIPSKTLDESFMNATTYRNEEFIVIEEIMKKYVNFVKVR